MDKFKRRSITKQMIPETDQGVSVAELLSIVEDNDLSKLLLNLLKTDQIRNEFIAIKGAQTLVNIQKSINNRFKKEDLKSSISNISLYNDDEFTINFNNARDNIYFKQLNKQQLTTIPVYSATREFFSELYQMDRYATKLISEGHKHILETNLQMLKSVHNSFKRFRILHDKEENIFYLRGIISLNNYFNYDDNLAVVLALLSLHAEMKKTGVQYALRLCEYNESFIRVFFESSEFKELESIGRVKNIIEVSNDEIRREALRFTGVCSIEFGNVDGQQSELFIRPQEIKSRILSIGHNRIPKTAIEELANIENATSVHSNLYDDILKIRNINNPEQIKHLVRSKVENAKTDDVKKFKAQILHELNGVAMNIIQLLTMFSKIELLAGEDIEAAEFIRFIIYQALIERK